jgi:hypothetical protein
MKQSDITKYLINSENDKYYYYYLHFNIISPYVKNWSRNRTQDDQKVIEMYETYIEKKHLHFFLHLAFDKEEKMVCYDGNHRLRVLEKLLETDNIDPMIFISVMWKSNYTDIFEDFKNLNKQSVVPELYIEQAKYSEVFTKKIEKMVNKYTKDYKYFVKPSRNQKAPHFNVGSFYDAIIYIYEKLPKEKQDLDIIQNGLYQYQDHIKNNVADIKNKNYEKCNKYNFWLFYKLPLDTDTIISYC